MTILYHKAYLEKVTTKGESKIHNILTTWLMDDSYASTDRNTHRDRSLTVPANSWQLCHTSMIVTIYNKTSFKIKVFTIRIDGKLGSLCQK